MIQAEGDRRLRQQSRSPEEVCELKRKNRRKPENFRPKIICRTITFALSFVLQKCGRPYGIGQEGEAQEALPMKEGSPL